MFGLLRLVLLPVRLPFMMLGLVRGLGAFITCVAPLIIAASISGGIAWFAFVR